MGSLGLRIAPSRMALGQSTPMTTWHSAPTSPIDMKTPTVARRATGRATARSACRFKLSAASKMSAGTKIARMTSAETVT
jgi:hypothetical protein